MENNILKKKIGKIFFPLLALAAVIVASYFYLQLNKVQQEPQSVAQQETADLVAKISKLMVLPTGETPTFATVSNPTLLKDQPFFISAQKGDKVLIYTQAKKVILYSVPLNKIINVASLNGTQQAVTLPPITETDTSTQKEP